MKKKPPPIVHFGDVWLWVSWVLWSPVHFDQLVATVGSWLVVYADYVFWDPGLELGS